MEQADIADLKPAANRRMGSTPLSRTKFMNRRVLICGDRNWNNYELVYNTLFRENVSSTKPPIECVIEGEARGADSCGRKAAGFLGIPILAFPADWKEYGKAAGPIRNQQMIDEGKPTEVWAFHNDLKNSKGTKDMVLRSRKAGLPVWVHTEKETWFVY